MADEPKPEPLKRMSELLEVRDDGERSKHEMRILDGLLAQAIKAGKALKIFEAGQRMLRSRRR